MEQNFEGLNFSPKGTLKLNGLMAYNKQGAPESVGGFVSGDNTVEAYYGRVLSTLPDSPYEFFVGLPTVNHLVVGVLAVQEDILQNVPSKPKYILKKTQADAVYFGKLWFAEWDTTFVGAISPKRYAQVIFSNATGLIGFLETGAGLPVGYTKLNASVKEVDINSNGVLIFFNISDIVSV